MKLKKQKLEDGGAGAFYIYLKKKKISANNQIL